MSEATTTVAVAALRYWAERALGRDGRAALPDEHTTDIVRRAARLVGTPADQQDDWLTKPLQSIFSQIQPRNDSPGSASAPLAYVPRAPLRIDENTLFPTMEPPRTAADALLQGLAAATATLPSSPVTAVEEWLAALQRHAWCLPSPLPGVSLYDFARTHAAVAAALAQHDGDLFLLGGDLSGVQDFIYTLTAAGATRSLRGRSFYLQLLTEACARLLLRAAAMPLTNLLYAGGGRFYLLLPGEIGGQAASTWLAARQSVFDSFFLYRHQADLYLALGGAPVTHAQLADQKGFRQVWRLAAEDISRTKRRRFSALGDQLTLLFTPQGHGGNTDDACAVCGYQGAAADFETDEDGTRRCQLCDSFEELGRLLHNAEYLALSHLARPLPTAAAFRHDQRRARWPALLDELGVHVQLFRDGQKVEGRDNRGPAEDVRYVSVLHMVDRPNLKRPTFHAPAAYSFRPVANTTPTMRASDLKDWKPAHPGERAPKIDDVKPFGVMVEQSRGVKRLGVLRMDVDNLGDIFSRKLTSGLAHVSALSAALALFFEGWVGHVCDEINRTAKQGSVYCIYSGGDDLFVVGSWHLLPELARRISADLARYSGGHPCVHVSAGISLHPAKFPLYQAAKAAETELQRAKQSDDKAALGFLEQVVKWQYADQLFDLVHHLDAHVKSDADAQTEPGSAAPLPRSFLQTLQALYLQYAGSMQQRKRDGKTAKPHAAWVWRGNYQLARVAQQLERKAATRELSMWVTDAVRKRLLANIGAPPSIGARYIEQLGLAARWVQLLNRKDREHGNGE